MSIIGKLYPIIRKRLWLPLMGYLLVFRSSSYLRSTGWVESFKSGVPCRNDGSPLPWMNYPVIAFLEERLQKDSSLFEFGSGYSTKFFAQRVKDVTSVEYDIKWFEKLKDNLPANVKLLFREKDIDGNYCRLISEQNRQYDIVVVDGRDRVNCVKTSLKCLTTRGIVILDDSQREKYKSAFEHVAAKGFRVLHWEGIKPTSSRAERTSIIYRDGNCLGI
jgi:hypothetical protein